MSPGVRVPPLLLLAVVLHTAVFPQLRLFDVTADVLLLVTVAAGIAGGPERGAVAGFVTGILADSFLQTPFGLSALVFSLVGWGVGSFQTRVLHANWWIPMLTAALATAAGMVLFALLGFVVGEDQLLSFRLVRIVLATGLWSALLAPFFVRILRWALVVDPTRVGLTSR